MLGRSSPPRRRSPHKDRAITFVTLSWFFSSLSIGLTAAAETHQGILISPWSNDAAEPNVTRRRVHVFRMAGGRAVAAAVIRRAQMRAAFDDLAGNLGGGLAGVVAPFLTP